MEINSWCSEGLGFLDKRLQRENMNIPSPGVITLVRFHGCYVVFLSICTALLYFRIKKKFLMVLTTYIIIYFIIVWRGFQVNTCWMNECLFWLLVPYSLPLILSTFSWKVNCTIMGKQGSISMSSLWSMTSSCTW